MKNLSDKILRALCLAPKNSLEFWQLSKNVGSYIPELVKILEGLEKQNLVILKDARVTLKNKKALPKKLQSKKVSTSEVMKKYKKIRDSIHFESDNFDQLMILPEGIENKLLLLLKNDDLLNQDILCIGDDDLFSIACALTGEPRSITVFDIDPTIIKFLKKISPKLPVPIKVKSVDFLNKLPKNLRAQFDVFITEPPDTLKGMELFMTRGMECLRENGAAYFGMTKETMSLKQWREIELIALQNNFVITDVLNDAELYEILGDENVWKGFEKLPKWTQKPAQEPWFISTLFRAQAVGKPKIKNRIKFQDAAKELITSLR